MTLFLAATAEPSAMDAFFEWARIEGTWGMAIVIFGLVLSEIINRVYAALLGMVGSLGLYMLIFEKPELHEVMGHVEWGTILLLFCTPSETGTRNLLIPRAADQEITSSHLAQV